MDDEAVAKAADEAYLLLLLSDANLPTGSFVASSGLESSIKHGFFSDRSQESPFVGNDTSEPSSPTPSAPRMTVGTVNFLRDSLLAYSRSTLAFIRAVYEALDRRKSGSDVSRTLKEIVQLDGLYEAMTLNHVARRASKAQGVALLTLYTKGFSRPAWLPSEIASTQQSDDSRQSTADDELINELKRLVRRGDTPGHLPICWGVLAACLGLSLERSQHLHIFLHARALLSASVRLNTVGPYASQQLLLHVVKPLVEDAVEKCKDIRLDFVIQDQSAEGKDGGGDASDGDWDLKDDGGEGPASTWPLGEILAGRHDLQHSRIFNS